MQDKSSSFTAFTTTHTPSLFWVSHDRGLMSRRGSLSQSGAIPSALSICVWSSGTGSQYHLQGRHPLLMPWKPQRAQRIVSNTRAPRHLTVSPSASHQRGTMCSTGCVHKFNNIHVTVQENKINVQRTMR